MENNAKKTSRISVFDSYKMKIKELILLGVPVSKIFKEIKQELKKSGYETTIVQFRYWVKKEITCTMDESDAIC
jgi:hypothetical protein